MATAAAVASPQRVRVQRIGARSTVSASSSPALGSAPPKGTMTHTRTVKTVRRSRDGQTTVVTRRTTTQSRTSGSGMRGGSGGVSESLPAVLKPAFVARKGKRGKFSVAQLEAMTASVPSTSPRAVRPSASSSSSSHSRRPGSTNGGVGRHRRAVARPQGGHARATRRNVSQNAPQQTSTLPPSSRQPTRVRNHVKTGARSGPSGVASASTATPSVDGVCRKCGDKLHGRIVQFNGQWYHAEHLVCHGPCGKVIDGATQVATRKGQPYCKPCATSLFAKTCAVCNKPILKKMSMVRGTAYHPKCFRCTACKQPIRQQFNMVGNQPYCGEHYVELCKNQQCFCCHEVYPSADDVFRLSDGRITCRRCDATAVWDRGEVESCFSDARACFFDMGFTKMKDPLFASIKVELATPQQLLEQARRKRTCGSKGQPLGLTVAGHVVRVERMVGADGEARPFTPSGVKAAATAGVPNEQGSDMPRSAAVPKAAAKKKSGHGLRVGRVKGGKLGTRSQRLRADGSRETKETFVRKILVMKGLPRVRMAAVLAHEVCHAFMGLYRVPIRQGDLVEGLCELWAFVYLQQRQDNLGCDEAARWMKQMMDNPDPVYGGGFRKVKASFETFKASSAGAGAGAGGGNGDSFVRFVRLLHKNRGVLPVARV